MAKQDTRTEITVSNATVLRVIGIVLGAFLFLVALQKASHALVLIFSALFLALALNAPVHWLAEHWPGKRRGSRKLGTAAAFLVVVLFLTGFLASIVPPLVKQTSNFVSATPGLIDDLRSNDSSLGKFVQKYDLEDQVQKLSTQLSDNFSNIGTGALSSLSKVSSGVAGILAVLVMTFMMLIEGPSWMNFVRQFVPAKNQERAKRLSDDMYRVIRGYVNGQVILAAVAAVMIFVPLLILGVDYPIALMVIVFICGLIPMVGHLIGSMIVTLVALFTSFWAALIILAYYILYQQIENYVIQPRVQSNTTDLPPLMVFMSVLVGISFGGLLGGLVAIPIAGCIRILLLDYLEFKGKLTKVAKRS